MTLTQNNNRWPIIVLAICAAAFFWDGILLNHAFLLRDTFCDFLPYRALQKRALAAGHLPVWNPFSGCGQPFLGDPQCAALYPLHVVFDVLPLPTALIVSQLLHTFIAACGAYLLARQWRCSKPAAIVSAIAYSIGTCQIAWMEFLYATCVLAWVPWVLWATGRVVTTRKSASIALLAFIVAVQYLGGNTELFAFSCIILGLYSIIVIPAHVGWRGAIRSWGAIAIAFVIAAALTAPDWLMLAQRAALSVRTASFDPRVDEASVSPMHWQTLILPFLFGRPGYPDKFWSPTLGEFWIGTCYVGIVPLILAGVALALGWRKPIVRDADPTEGASGRANRSRLAFFAVLLVMGVLLASGKYTPIFGFFHDFVPGFTRLRWPAKSLVFAHFALSMLAGLGANLLIDVNGFARVAKVAWWLALSLCAMIAACGVMIALLDPISQGDLFTRMTFGRAPATFDRVHDFSRWAGAAGFVAIVAGISVTLLRASNQRIRLGAVAMLLAIAFGDLFLVSRRVHPIGPAEIYRFPSEAVTQVLGPNPSPLQRIYTNYSGLQQMLYGDPDLAHWQFAWLVAAGNTWLNADVSNVYAGGLNIAEYQKFYDGFAKLDTRQVDRLADVMGVTNVIVPDGSPSSGPPMFQPAMASARPTALPRAMLFNAWERNDDFDHELARLLSAGFDPKTTEIVSDPSAPAPSKPSVARGVGSVKDVRYDWDRVEIDVEMRGSALLVLNDAWYPGWQATVDAKPAPICRANLIFRGVLLEPGAKHVTFEYRPWQVRVGFAISGVTLCAIVASLLIQKMRNRG